MKLVENLSVKAYACEHTNTAMNTLWVWKFCWVLSLREKFEKNVKA